MRPRAAILILLFSLPGALRGQGASAGLSDTLAEVGSKVITTRDLVDRLELMPWPGKEADSAKIKALRSLVAEEILGLESGAEGIVPDSALQAYAGNLEKLFVRDELYKRQVRGKTTVAEKDVREGVRRFARRVRILMIGAPGEAAARVLSRSLRAGGDPDSVIHEAAGRYPLPADTVVVTFGLLDRSQEDAVYALTPEVPATDPLLTGRGGWVVLLLLDQVTDPEYAKRSIPDRIEKVKERIRKRNELVRAEKYQVELLSPRRAETRPAPFELLARTVRRILASDSARYSTPNGYRFDRGVDVAMDSLAGHLREVLVELPGGRMTIGDVLEGYRTYESVFPTLATADFLRRMNASIRDIVGRELLAREAYRLGLDRAEDVRHDVDLWSHYWRARALMEKLTGDVRVTNDEVLRVLEGKADVIGRDYEINIREILSDSLREALACMEKIVAGGT